MFENVFVMAGQANKRGVQYETKNGERTANLGEQSFATHTAEKAPEELQFKCVRFLSAENDGVRPYGGV